MNYREEDLHVYAVTDGPATAYRAGGALSLPAAIVMASRPTFGRYDTAELIGLWLGYGRRPAANFLSPFLSTEGFEFTPEEYLGLKKRLERATRHFARLPRVSDALDDLNTGFFRHRGLAESRAVIEDHLKHFLGEGEALHREYVLTINRRARTELFRRRRELRTEGDRLEEAVAEAKRTVASGNRKQRREAGDRVAKLTVRLHETRQGLNRLARDLQAEGLALSSRTVPGEADLAARLGKLGDRLGRLVRAIDEAGLYQLPLVTSEAATTPRQLKLLEQVLDRLRHTRDNLGEYESFYHRRSFWYEQPPPLRRLLAPLLNLSPEAWSTAFSAWYLERCLERLDAAPETTPAPADAPKTYRALDDSAATPVHIAGLRRAQLALQQSFDVQRAPNWALRPPPPGEAMPDHPAFRASGGSSWQPLSDYRPPAPDTLDLWLPWQHDYPGRILAEAWPALSLTDHLTVLADWSPDYLTQTLLSDGISDVFLAATLVRAAGFAASEPFDRRSFTALASEVRTRFGLPSPRAHPLMESLYDPLLTALPDCHLTVHAPWRDTFLPLLIIAPDGRRTVLLPDGYLPGSREATSQGKRAEHLRVANFRLVEVAAYPFWIDPSAALEELLTALSRPGRSR